jgi:hypothetical protein
VPGGQTLEQSRGDSIQSVPGKAGKFTQIVGLQFGFIRSRQAKTTAVGTAALQHGIQKVKTKVKIKR